MYCTGISKPHEVIKYFFLSLSPFYMFPCIRLESTKILFKWSSKEGALEGFICTFFLLIFLSIILQSSKFNYSSSTQCFWTRMADQIIESYQFKCNFAEPKKSLNQKIPLILSNRPYQNILKWLWNDLWANHLLMTVELYLSS